MGITSVTMLPKKPTVERPIGLMHVCAKAMLKSRWHLIEEWNRHFQQIAPWDQARVGVSAIEVGAARLLRTEIHAAHDLHGVTLFIDLSTFFESVDHTRLIQVAGEVGFPPLLLELSLRLYRGARVIQAEGTATPPQYATRGIIAGCPMAPSLSKVALFKACQQVWGLPHAQAVDAWLDDVSIDLVHENAGAAAQAAVHAFRTFKQAATAEGLTLSEDKTCFVCTTAAAHKPLKKVNPKGGELVTKDLGVDSHGGRRRRTGTAQARARKAGLRQKRLHSLRVPQIRHRVRAQRASIEAAGGVAPKRLKHFRTLAANVAHKHKLGSLEVVMRIGEAGVKDPALTVLKQHWKTLWRIFSNMRHCTAQLQHTWGVLWGKLGSNPHKWKSVKGPLAAMVAYLSDLGVNASSLWQWGFPEEVEVPGVAGRAVPRQIEIDLNDPYTEHKAASALRGAMRSLPSRMGRHATVVPNPWTGPSPSS